MSTWRDRLAALASEKIPEAPFEAVPKVPDPPLGTFDTFGTEQNDGLREIGTPATEAIRSHLLTLAADEGLPVGLVHGLADKEVMGYAGHTDRELQAYLESLDAGHRFLDQGMTPPAWGEPVACTCTGCGPVLLWAGCPAEVTACPWCFRRASGKPIARPRAPPVVRWVREDTEKASTRFWRYF